MFDENKFLTNCLAVGFDEIFPDENFLLYSASACCVHEPQSSQEMSFQNKSLEWPSLIFIFKILSSFSPASFFLHLPDSGFESDRFSFGLHQ